MDKNDQLCGQISTNIRDLASDIEIIDDQLFDLNANEETLTVRLDSLQNEHSLLAALSGMPARIITGGAFGAGITMIDAIARTRKLSQLGDDIRRTNSELNEVRDKQQFLKRQRQSKLDLIRHEQADFNAHDCFHRGFGHEVLNLPRVR